MEKQIILSVLQVANRILSSAILITTFSLALYILRHNFRSKVGRAFCVLLMFVMVVYLGDVALLEVVSPHSVMAWLKFQWVGIAFVPAAYLHFSDALLSTTGSVSKWRQQGVRLSYAGSVLTLLLVILSSWIVHDGVLTSPAPRLAAGPLFWIFSAYFFAVVISGAININRARRRSLTATSRRRMGYLTVSFVAPALGVFPYMLITTLPALLPQWVLLSILLVSNVGIALMIVVMAYTVAYFGAFNPDRVIKYDLIEYLLRGPLLASLVTMIIVAMPKVGNVLGLPVDILTIFASVLTIILVQLGVNLAHPFLNRLVYRQDLNQVSWLQELDQRLLTPSDLKQFLENVLSSIAELLRVHQAFVVAQDKKGFQIEAYCGEKQTVQAFLQKHNLEPTLQIDPEKAQDNLCFTEINGYMLRPLCTQNRDAVLGLLIIERWTAELDIEQNVLDMIEQVEVALEDRLLQQGIFVALQQIMPDIERIQKQRRLMEYATSLRPIEESPINNPNFTRWVKEALTHYWGGPKLTSSPLLKLNVVTMTGEKYNGDAVHALREVLQQAIDTLRPAGERSMTAAEWTLYNILDLKFREGNRMCDIANQLAISESDLYRKQRTAIAEMSRMLANMERQITSV